MVEIDELGVYSRYDVLCQKLPTNIPFERSELLERKQNSVNGSRNGGLQYCDYTSAWFSEAAHRSDGALPILLNWERRSEFLGTTMQGRMSGEFNSPEENVTDRLA